MREMIEKLVEVVKEHGLSLLVLALFVLLAAAMRMQEQREKESFQGIVEREAETGDTQSQSFRFYLEEEGGSASEASEGERTEAEDSGSLADEIGEQELTLDISPLVLDRDEAFDLLEQAVDEWEADYLGENVSANEVRYDLVLPTSLCGGLVTVSYESSKYEIVETSGTVHTDDLPAEGEVAELTARFSYDEYTRIETFSLRIMPPEEGTAEWIVSELEKEVSRTEEDSRQQETFSLPDTVGGYRVVWEQTESSVWIWFLFLGALAVFCLEWRGRQNEKDRQKKRAAQLESEYPQMVDQFAVLLESGMTIRKAWERILVRGCFDTSAGKRKGYDSPVYLEEMWITYREIRDGRGEREAYERFGNRIGLMPYKRFSSILTQNLSKGTSDVKELLKKESKEALEMRRNRARKLGEEAGTKLLFPMLVMLLLILLILLVPALSEM